MLTNFWIACCACIPGFTQSSSPRNIRSNRLWKRYGGAPRIFCQSRWLDRLRLKRALDDVASLYDQRRRVRALEEQLLRDLQFHGIVGKSQVMLEVLILRARWRGTIPTCCWWDRPAPRKSWWHGAIHQLSPVSQHRLAVCNCSAMVDTLLDSQLFGHVRGAFTGATEMRPGMFEYADGGTVSWTRWAKRRWPCRPSCCG